ncbi:hypothetical protein CYMTET_18425 [Cymbomonas tetramitiformis]|uniref:TLC domain-containing protein n=1 Tax=Cymbomonas tetramitiformis TaxID=36881 RepID=A0AAE0G848_9CHLO|nr:hypothetical protein CYMTET_18425 [Cymbomonas tetramitiformis]
MVAPTLQDTAYFLGIYFVIYWIIFAAAYLLAYLAPRQTPRPKPGGSEQLLPSSRIVFANRMCSITHAIIAVYCFTNVVLVKLPDMNTSSRWFLPLDYLQESDPTYHWVVPILVAYAAADTVYMFIWEMDMIFVYHHLAVIIGVLPLHLCEHGWMMAVVATVLAEFTNPLQNTRQYAYDFGFDTINKVLYVPFMLIFTSFRGFIMPTVLIDYFIFIFLESHSNDPSIQFSLSCMKLCWLIFAAGCLGSLIWLKDAVAEFVGSFKKAKIV